MKSGKTSYQVFLLRIWAEGKGPPKAPGQTRWRFSLQDVGTRRRRGFASLSALIAFLEQSIDEQPEGEDNDGPNH